MLIYFFMITYVLVMYFVCKHFKNGLQFYYKSTLLLLFLISSLRSEYMGADYQTYIGIFEGIQIYGMKYPYEKGYVLLNMLIGMISEHYITLGVATSAVFFVCFYKYCYKYVELKNIHLVLYVFVMNPYLYIQSSFNILRQSCATAILMLGVHLLIEKKYWKYLIIVLLAAQFHSAAYVFILLIFFRMIDWKKDYFIIICSVSFVFNILLKNDQFLRRVANIFGFSSYIGYGNTEFDFPLFAVFVFAVNIFLLMNYNILFDNEREKFFLDLYMLALSSLPLLVKNDIAYRIYIILAFLSLPAIPIICKKFSTKANKWNYYICAGGYVLYYLTLFIAFVASMSKSQNIHYIPFEFFWQV